MLYRLSIAAVVALLVSCTSAKLSVPETFSSQATKMPVKGLNGWQINQQLSFGPYQTSKIKRGWDFRSSLQYTKFSIDPAEMLLRVFDIHTDKKKLNQRNRFQYSIHHNGLDAEVYATEQFNEQQLVYKSNNPQLGSLSRTNQYRYAFTAAIVPLQQKESNPWSLVLINRYDIGKDTARRLFDRPYVEEEGYVTNGKEHISIRPLRIEQMNTKSGRATKVLGGPLLAGYELQWDGGVVAVIDILDNSIWVYNNLPPEEKMLLAATASAILLKRMQDVEKDRDTVDSQ